MIRNALIAFTAAAVLATGFSASANAKTKIDVDFNIGGGGFWVGPGYYDDDFYGYGDDCHYVKVKHKKMKANGTIKVWFTKELVCY